MKYLKILSITAIFSMLLGCDSFFANKETSEIGSFDWTCFNKEDMLYIVREHSPDKITDSIFKDGLKQVKNHFLKPEYVLYFDKAPREIVGIDSYSIRVAFNPDISYDEINGLSSELSDSEQVRIRNRILKLLWEKECAEGRRKLEKWMREPAVFSKEYYDAQ